MGKMATHKFNGQFITAIRGLYLSMNFLGLWPRTNSQIWHNPMWYIQSMGLVFQLFGPVAGLIVKRQDTKKIIRNMGLVIPMAAICVKWLTFAKHGKIIEQLLYDLEKDWINLEKNNSMIQGVPDSKRIMTSHARSAKIFFHTYVTMLMLAVVNLVRDSFVARNSRNANTDWDELLPLPNSWFPLDYNRSSNIQFLAVAQSVCSTTMLLTDASMGSLFIAMTLHLCGQFKILRFFIESIRYDPLRPNSCESNIRLMAKRHQRLLNVGDKLETAYSYLVLEQLVGGVLTVCCLLYTTLEEMENANGSVSVVAETGFLCAASLQMIFAFCLVGEYLANQLQSDLDCCKNLICWNLNNRKSFSHPGHGFHTLNYSSHSFRDARYTGTGSRGTLTCCDVCRGPTSIDVAMAVYNVQWYDCTRSINLSFSIVMTRARRPVEITAAKLLTMSLESFTVLMKATASYLSVLRAIGVGDDYDTPIEE